MRQLIGLVATLLLVTNAHSADEEIGGCGANAVNRDFSVMDASLFRVTIFDEPTQQETLVGTATLVAIDEDPGKDNSKIVGYFLTAAHVFESDGSLPKAGKLFSGIIGLRPCSSRLSDPEPGISTVTEIFHRSTLREADLSVLRAKIDTRLVIDDVVEIAKLFSGNPREIRNHKNLAYAGFPANAPNEIAPFGDRVTAVRYIPELARPWAVVGIAKSPDEGQSGSPLFDMPEENRPTIFGLIVDVPTRDEVFMQELHELDKDWIERSFLENRVVLVQPLEPSSPILRHIPPGMWVRDLIKAIRTGDSAKVASKLHFEYVRQPAVDIDHLLRALEKEKALAKLAASSKTRLGRFLAFFSIDAYERFHTVVQPYLTLNGDASDVRAFVGAELGRELLSEIAKCSGENPDCATTITARQADWMRETAIRLIESDLQRIDPNNLEPGSRAAKYVANLHLDVAKTQRLVAKNLPRGERNLAREQRSLLAALALNPTSTVTFDYTGDFFKETKRPVSAATAYLVAAAFSLNEPAPAKPAQELRQQCDSSVRQWRHYENAAIMIQTTVRPAPGLYAFVHCVPPRGVASTQIVSMQSDLETALAWGEPSDDIIGEKMERRYMESIIRAGSPRREEMPGSSLRDSESSSRERAGSEKLDRRKH